MVRVNVKNISMRLKIQAIHLYQVIILGMSLI